MAIMKITSKLNNEKDKLYSPSFVIIKSKEHNISIKIVIYTLQNHQNKIIARGVNAKDKLDSNE
jgi:hypothetical protein